MKVWAGTTVQRPRRSVWSVVTREHRAPGGQSPVSARHVREPGTALDRAQGRFILHRIQFSQVYGANPVPWDVNNKTMPFFPHKYCCFVCAQQMFFFANTRVNPKNTTVIPLSYWECKSIALMRGFQTWSQN